MTVVSAEKSLAEIFPECGVIEWAIIDLYARLRTIKFL